MVGVRGGERNDYLGLPIFINVVGPSFESLALITCIILLKGL